MREARMKFRLRGIVKWQGMAVVLCLAVLFCSGQRGDHRVSGGALLDGEADPQQHWSVVFATKASCRSRKLKFYCAPAAEKAKHRVMCHQEFGLFFPGNSYDLRFSYAEQKTPAPMSLSMKSARLSDGSIWMAKPRSAVAGRSGSSDRELHRVGQSDAEKTIPRRTHEASC